jgi:hypothetical protein
VLDRRVTAGETPLKIRPPAAPDRCVIIEQHVLGVL